MRGVLKVVELTLDGRRRGGGALPVVVDTPRERAGRWRTVMRLQALVEAV